MADGLSFQSPFAPREGKDFRWSGLSYTVKTKKREVKILSDVFGSVPGGKVCAILGPSGAGKSSLLNVLAGRVVPGGANVIGGEVTVNGTPIKPTAFRRQIAYVMQDDALFATLTPREALRFSVSLRIPNSVSRDQKEKLVTMMLGELGLEGCADTLIGNALIKGISGGERKRTSVGVELVVNPSLVFLDEPTSGLDSFSAHQCASLLRKVAGAGSSVVCTIHQPSSEVFHLFDLCILLKDGHVVFEGEVEKINEHFAQCGYEVPPNYNPADHIMDVVQDHDLATLKAKNLLMEPEARSRSSSAAASFAGAFEKFTVHQGSVFQELWWLVWRECIGIRRDKGQIGARFAMTAFLGLLFGLIFENAGGRDDREPENLSTHFGALTMVSIYAMFGNALPLLLAFPIERPIFLREYSTGTYRVGTYGVAKILVDLPVSFVQTMVLVMVTYFLMDLDGNFGVHVAVLWLLGLAASSVAMVLGSVAEDPKTAAEAMPALFVPQILFAGFFVRIEQIPVFLRWAQYLCSLKYAINMLMLNEFDDCGDHQQVCDRLKDDNNVDEDLTWFYVLVLLVLFVGFRVVSLGLLRIKARKFY